MCCFSLKINYILNDISVSHGGEYENQHRRHFPDGGGTKHL
jgi:hypothetical protein